MYRMEEQMEKVQRSYPKNSQFWPDPNYKRITNSYLMGQQVKKDYGEKPSRVRKFWKYDMTDSSGFNALCRIHAYRISRGRRKVNGKMVCIPIICSCGDMFQFRDHWQCQKAREGVTDEEQKLIESALGEWKGRNKMAARKKLADNAEKVLKKLTAIDTEELNGIY